jgi:hypothetical protein
MGQEVATLEPVSKPRRSRRREEADGWETKGIRLLTSAATAFRKGNPPPDVGGYRVPQGFCNRLIRVRSSAWPAEETAVAAGSGGLNQRCQRRQTGDDDFQIQPRPRALLDQPSAGDIRWLVVHGAQRSAPAPGGYPSAAGYSAFGVYGGRRSRDITPAGAGTRSTSRPRAAARSRWPRPIAQ